MNSFSPRRPIRAFHSTAGRLSAERGYRRDMQLPKLIGLWPSELGDCSVAGTERVIALLRKAIRGERRCGQSGHWTYDVNRHLALSEALKAEQLRLAGLKKTLAAGKIKLPQAARAKARATLVSQAACEGAGHQETR